MHYDRKVAYYTLGCKLNFSETSTIGRQLSDAGYQKVDFSEPADYYIINTCSVTEEADKKCRYVVRQALSRNPEAKVVVIGCYAQLKPDEIAGIPGVSAVLGANEKFNIAAHLEKLNDRDSTLVEAAEIKDVRFYASAHSFGERTRSFLKIQDGCDYFCSFCTIPLARGKSRSMPIADTLKYAQELVQSGIKEVVITGVNTGDFGKSSDGKSRTNETFFDLLRQLEAIEGIERWRISSIEPNLLSPEIIDRVAASNKLMPHFHIPLQSGSDTILKQMRRKYDAALYRSRVDYIREKMPTACIGVDVIVGFPGETEAEFRKTYDFIQELPVSYLHVFTYSEREHTKAAEMPGAIPIQERRKRNEMLRILSEKKRRAFYEAQLGSIRTVLWEAENDEGMMYGFTDNYIKVRTPYDAHLVNSIRKVELISQNRHQSVDVVLLSEREFQNP